MIPMIDWLSVTVDIEKYDINIFSIKEKLEDAKALAKHLQAENKSEKAIVELFGQTFKIYP